MKTLEEILIDEILIQEANLKELSKSYPIIGYNEEICYFNGLINGLCLALKKVKEHD